MLYTPVPEAATLKAEAEAKETALAEEEAASPATKKPKLCSSPEGTEGSERDTCTQLGELACV